MTAKTTSDSAATQTNLVSYIFEKADRFSDTFGVTSAEIINDLSPILIGLSFLGFVIVGYSLLISSANDTFKKSIPFFIKFILIFTIVGSAATYQRYVVDLIELASEQFVEIINCNPAADPSCVPDYFSQKKIIGTQEDPANPGTYLHETNGGYLDQQFSSFFIIAKAGWVKANVNDNNIGLWVLTFFLLLISVMYILGSALIIVSLHFLIKILLLIGPFFIVLALFEATAGFFKKWVKVIVQIFISKILVCWVVAFLFKQTDLLIRSIITDDGIENFTTGFTAMDAHKGTDKTIFQIINETYAISNDYFDVINLFDVTIIGSLLILGLILVKLSLRISEELANGLSTLGNTINNITENLFSSSSVHQNAYTQENNNANFSSLFKTSNKQYTEYNKNINNSQSMSAYNQKETLGNAITNSEPRQDNSYTKRFRG